MPLFRAAGPCSVVTSKCRRSRVKMHPPGDVPAVVRGVGRLVRRTGRPGRAPARTGRPPCRCSRPAWPATAPAGAAAPRTGTSPRSRSPTMCRIRSSVSWRRRPGQQLGRHVPDDVLELRRRRSAPAAPTARTRKPRCRSPRRSARPTAGRACAGRRPAGRSSAGRRGPRAGSSSPGPRTAEQKPIDEMCPSPICRRLIATRSSPGSQVGSGRGAAPSTGCTAPPPRPRTRG